MAGRLAVIVVFACLACTVVSRRVERVKSQQLKQADVSESSATQVQEEVDKQQAGDWLDDVRVGDEGGPLVPALVPRAGETFELVNREAFDFFESNAYHWNLVNIESNTSKGRTTDTDKWFAKIDGNFFSNKMWKKTTHVHNNHDEKLFTIEMTKHMWNPLRWTWSFRIKHPETGNILFTINKDWFGGGFFMLRDEWRVYRGRQRDDDQIYYCVSSLTGYDYKCFHDKDEWKNSAKPAAHFSQSMLRDFVGLPDSSTLKVEAGEDTALLLATSVIMDMVYEQEEANDKAKEQKEHHQQQQQKCQQQCQHECPC